MLGMQARNAADSLSISCDDAIRNANKGHLHLGSNRLRMLRLHVKRYCIRG
jgi:hypothetical protein